MTPVRVLINAVHAKSGGGVTYLRNILPLLAEDPRLELHLAVQGKQAEMIRALAGPVPVHVLPSRPTLWTVFVQEQTALPLLARRLGARVLFSPANFGPLLGARTVILLRNAFAVSEMDRRPMKRLYWAAVKTMSRLSFLTCRRAIAVSQSAGDAFLKAFGREGDARLAVVHHGVSPLFSPGDQTREPGRLLAVSDIYVQKNFETLLRAVALLPAARLDIAGRPLDPDYFQRLTDLCAELGIAERVSFLGSKSQAEVAELYRRASVFVFPSLVETFGNPLLEAMASGLPVVCSDAAASPEVAGKAALYARPGDAAHMAEQIGRLLGDEALWGEMAAKGLDRAGNFTWAACARATAAVLVDAAR